MAGGGINAVSCLPAGVTVESSNLSYNSATAGGLLFSSECSNIGLQLSLVHHNRALGGSGGAMLLSSGASVVVLESSIAANSASDAGGAIACEGCAGFTLGDLQAPSVVGVVNNSAGTAGGGLFVSTWAEWATRLGRGVLIVGCTAHSGGGMALGGVSHAHVGAALVSNNTAGLVHDASDATPDRTYAGGGVALTGSSWIDLNHTFFVGNMANFGGAVGASASAYASMQGVVFSLNSAMAGGATYWGSADNTPLDRGHNTYTNNTASWYGKDMATAASRVASHAELCERLDVTAASTTAVFNDAVGGWCRLCACCLAGAALTVPSLPRCMLCAGGCVPVPDHAAVPDVCIGTDTRVTAMPSIIPRRSPTIPTFRARLLDAHGAVVTTESASVCTLTAKSATTNETVALLAATDLTASHGGVTVAALDLAADPGDFVVITFTCTSGASTTGSGARGDVVLGSPAILVTHECVWVADVALAWPVLDRPRVVLPSTPQSPNRVFPPPSVTVVVLTSPLPDSAGWLPVRLPVECRIDVAGRNVSEAVLSGPECSWESEHGTAAVSLFGDTAVAPLEPVSQASWSNIAVSGALPGSEVELHVQCVWRNVGTLPVRHLLPGSRTANASSSAVVFPAVVVEWAVRPPSLALDNTPFAEALQVRVRVAAPDGGALRDAQLRDVGCVASVVSMHATAGLEWIAAPTASAFQEAGEACAGGSDAGHGLSHLVTFRDELGVRVGGTGVQAVGGDGVAGNVTISCTFNGHHVLPAVSAPVFVPLLQATLVTPPPPLVLPSAAHAWGFRVSVAPVGDPTTALVLRRTSVSCAPVVAYAAGMGSGTLFTPSAAAASMAEGQPAVADMPLIHTTAPLGCALNVSVVCARPQGEEFHAAAAAVRTRRLAVRLASDAAVTVEAGAAVPTIVLRVMTNTGAAHVDPASWDTVGVWMPDHAVSCRLEAWLRNTAVPGALPASAAVVTARGGYASFNGVTVAGITGALCVCSLRGEATASRAQPSLTRCCCNRLGGVAATGTLCMRIVPLMVWRCRHLQRQPMTRVVSAILRQSLDPRPCCTCASERAQPGTCALATAAAASSALPATCPQVPTRPIAHLALPGHTRFPLAARRA